jgi:hypothetical protein
LRWNPFALRFASPALANRKAASDLGEVVEKWWRKHGEIIDFIGI